MKIWLASLHPAGGRARKSSPFDAIADDYLGRIAHYCPVEALRFADEPGLFDWIGRQHARSGVYTVLLDSAGAGLSSRQFATRIGALRDQGRQHLLFAIGPADGWVAATPARADLLLSLGPMTLPHALARILLAEQVYRALTILAGHPYHSGH
jgi:23S rRNA (pseudouridine1915-N3)-methyltransferase